MSEKPAQSKIVMALICFFLGGLGIHRLMMGHSNWWMMLLSNILCGVGLLWALYDLVMILTGGLKMADGGVVLYTLGKPVDELESFA